MMLAEPTDWQRAEMRRLHADLGYGPSRLAMMFGVTYAVARCAVDERQRAAVLRSQTFRRMRARLAAAAPENRSRLLDLHAALSGGIDDPELLHAYFELGSAVFGRAFDRVPHGDICDRVVGDAVA